MKLFKHILISAALTIAASAMLALLFLTDEKEIISFRESAPGQAFLAIAAGTLCYWLTVLTSAKTSGKRESYEQGGIL